MAGDRQLSHTVPRSGASATPRRWPSFPIDDGTRGRLQPRWEMADDGESTLRALDDRHLGWHGSSAATGLCFLPDSRLRGLMDASKIIRLVEAETGRVIARLESPDPCDVIWATFSPDGSRLVLVTDDGPAVHVWDLRAIRKRLAAMGLDWDAPAYSDDDPAVPGRSAPAAASSRPRPAGRRDRTLHRISRDLDRAVHRATQERSQRHRGPPPSRSCLGRTSRFQEGVDDFTRALRERSDATRTSEPPGEELCKA